MEAGEKFKTVDEYMSHFSGHTLALLHQVREAVRAAAPKAQEVISYNMPGIKLNSIVVWYAGYKNHIGLYPKTKALIVFEKELSKYKTSKGAIQFPVDQPLPLALIKKIVKHRVAEDKEEALLKAALKKKKVVKKAS